MGVVSIGLMTDLDYHSGTQLFIFEDATADFMEAFYKKENLYSVWKDNVLVGVIQLVKEENAYLSLYINKPYRGLGIGTAALNLGEQILRDAKAKKIMIDYRLDYNAYKSFAEKHGYAKCFSSVYMEYKGTKFDLPLLPIREYNDDDYESAHELYARAFHEMRVRVGDFPESSIEEPNEIMREQWKLSKKERYVYTHSNQVIGYAHVIGNEIASISIKPEYQNCGIGRKFTKYVVNSILDEGYTTVSLYCVVGNWAKRLYDSLGFTDTYTVEFAVKRLQDG